MKLESKKDWCFELKAEEKNLYAVYRIGIDN